MLDSETAPLLAMLMIAGLKPPRLVEENSSQAAALYARIWTQAGISLAEALAATDVYLGELTTGAYPKAWPDPGAILARVPRLAAIHALGTDLDIDSTWSRMMFAVEKQVPLLGVLENDEDRTRAAECAGREGNARSRIQGGNVEEIELARRVFVREYRVRRLAQATDPTIKTRIETQANRLYLTSAR